VDGCKRKQPNQESLRCITPKYVIRCDIDIKNLKIKSEGQIRWEVQVQPDFSIDWKLLDKLVTRKTNATVTDRLEPIKE
jgi:hypothetical protein